MKEVEVTITRKVWSEACIHCGKVIQGYTPGQVKQKLSMHETNNKVCKELQAHHKLKEEEHKNVE
jgi:hypothetical protein